MDPRIVQRRLKTKWSLEAAQDLKAYYGIDSDQSIRDRIIEKLCQPDADPATFTDFEKEVFESIVAELGDDKQRSQ